MLDEKVLDDAIMAGFQDTMFGKEAGLRSMIGGAIKNVKEEWAAEKAFRTTYNERKAADKATKAAEDAKRKADLAAEAHAKLNKNTGFTRPNAEAPAVEKPADKVVDPAVDKPKSTDNLPANDKSKDKTWKHWLGYGAAGVGIGAAGGAGGYFFGRKKGQEDVMNQLNGQQA